MSLNKKIVLTDICCLVYIYISMSVAHGVSDLSTSASDR